MAFESILLILASALKIWATKLSRKYIDELTEIETQYREAINVEYRLRDHALIDDLWFRLQQLNRNIASDLGKPDPVD